MVTGCKRVFGLQTRQACTWRTGCLTCWGRSWRARCIRAAPCAPSPQPRLPSWVPGQALRPLHGAPSGSLIVGLQVSVAWLRGRWGWAFLVGGLLQVTLACLEVFAWLFDCHACAA